MQAQTSTGGGWRRHSRAALSATVLACVTGCSRPGADTRDSTAAAAKASGESAAPGTSTPSAQPARVTHQAAMSGVRKALVALAAATADTGRKRYLLRIANEPEYHDIQRLVTRDSAHFGPITSVSPAQDLLSIGDDEFDQPSGPGIHVAVVSVKGDPDPDTIPSYTDLKLRTAGDYCITIRGKNMSWTGYVLPLVDGRCVFDEGSAADREVQVRAHPRGPFTNRLDYPGAVRWDEGEVEAVDTDGKKRAALQPTIGVRCGIRWCEIGPRDFRTRPVELATHPKIPQRKWARVRGWNDQQWLAMPEGITGQLVPRYRAVIVPHQDLETYDLDKFRKAWQPVAYVLLQGPPESSSKYGKAGLGPDVKTLSLKAEDGKTPAGKDTTFWFALIEGSATQYNVDRADHAGDVIPSVTRWAWDEADEDMWIPCDDGCCRVLLGDERKVVNGTPPRR
jgi:hypothetical protein